jgi:hypothetical protein
VQNIPLFFAHRLRKAFEGMGTDDITLIRVVVSRFELDLGTVAEVYETTYGKSLVKAVEVRSLLFTFNFIIYLFLTLLERNIW